MAYNGDIYPGQDPTNQQRDMEYYGTGPSQQPDPQQQYFAQPPMGYVPQGIYQQQSLQAGMQPHALRAGFVPMGAYQRLQAGGQQQMMPPAGYVSNPNGPTLARHISQPSPDSRGMARSHFARPPVPANVIPGIYRPGPPVPPAGRAPPASRQRLPTFEDPAPPTINGPNFVNTLSMDGQYVITKILVQPNTTHKMNLGVFVVKHRVDGHLYVEKRLDRSTQGAWERVYQEVRILTRLNTDPGGEKPCLNWMNHETFSVRHVTDVTALYLEYCNQGNLGQFIKAKRDSGRICLEKWVWATVWALSRALCWMHWGIVDLGNRPHRRAMESWDAITHLDIKPENIFIKLDKSPASLAQNPRGIYQIVLGDFGCAVEANKVGVVQDLYVQAHGTRGWFPPENQHSTLYDERDVPYYGRKTDIWQVGGVIQCMMAMRNYPKQQFVEDDHPNFYGYSDELVEMMKMLMNRDWKQRPEAVEVAEMIFTDMRILGMPFEFGP